MWPFRKTKWVVVKQEIHPSHLEICKQNQVMPTAGTSFDTQRKLIVHYRDELSGNERVEKITL